MIGMNQATKLFRNGQKALVGIQNTVSLLWIRACQEDGIPTDSKFVQFSEGNKYAAFYNQAVQQMWAMQREYQAGGYVGLRITNGHSR